MISLTNITLQRGRKVLLQDANLTIHSGRAVALIGRNGCGKSSLFALFLAQIQAEMGEVKMPKGARLAHMAQEVPMSNRTALDYVLDGHRPFRDLQKQIAQVEQTDNHLRLAQLYEQFDAIGGYSVEHQGGLLLHGLGFDHSQHHKPVKAFSGGWRIRLNLAQALMCPSDIMLLDEPTNHLDLDTTYWLEQWLKRYQGTLVIISHDRDFIDNVCNEIVHIEQSKLNLYKGNYSAFERQRAERLSLQQADYDKQQKQIKHVQSFITRFKAKASKAKQAQSRVKQLANMELVAKAQVDSPFHFEFAQAKKMSNPLISMNDVELGYGDQIVLKEVKLNLHPGARIGLLGVNGAGKSTLIKALTGDLKPFSGEVVYGEHCYIGYFAQHQLEALDLQASALLHIQRISPQATEQKIRNFLGGFDFHGDKSVEPIAPFSGGEKARLALALIVWQQPNLLLLDEPTNHLDLDMRQALTLALQSFNGALVVVSHDRHLLRHSVDDYFLIHQGAVSPFDGTLEDYHRWMLESASQDKTKSQNKHNSKQPNKLNKKEQRQQAAENRKQSAQLNNRLKKVERQMHEDQAQLTSIEKELTNQDIYQVDNKAKLEQLLTQQARLKAALEQLESTWFEAHEAIEKTKL